MKKKMPNPERPVFFESLDAIDKFDGAITAALRIAQDNFVREYISNENNRVRMGSKI
jgi:hypothetical protein